MKISDIMNVTFYSGGKRNWNSKESAQEVLLQVSDLGDRSFVCYTSLVENKSTGKKL